MFCVCITFAQDDHSVWSRCHKIIWWNLDKISVSLKKVCTIKHVGLKDRNMFSNRRLVRSRSHSSPAILELGKDEKDSCVGGTGLLAWVDPR